MVSPSLFLLPSMNFQLYFKELQASLEAYMARALDYKDPDIAGLAEAAKYSVLNGGKRFRGVVALMIGKLLSENQDFLPLAAALEIIHSYSLIHDDLPAMDNDDYRRGKLSNHKVYGEDVAILAGDFLLVEAYRILAEELKDFKSENILKLISALSRKISIQGMAGGQYIDIKSSNKKISLETMERMHLYKTGFFIETSFIAPVYLVTGSEIWSTVFDLGLFARNLGLLFQVVDDILDEVGETLHLGKQSGSDKSLNKATFVSILGLEGARSYAEKLYLKTLNSTAGIIDTHNRELFVNLLNFCYKRTS